MNCEVCAKRVPKRNHKRFCSRKCRGVFLSTQTGDKTPHWKGGRIKNCTDCTAQISVLPSAVRCRSCDMKHRFKTNRGHFFIKGDRMGENNPSWVQDRTKLQRYGDANKDRRSYMYAEWRKRVWLRDNFACKIANPDCSGGLEAHHILGYTEFPELRYELNNGITLCHAHHPRKRAEEKRLSPYFQELVSASK